MRELSERERAFLRSKVPSEREQAYELRARRSPARNFGGRLATLGLSLLRYLPLLIGSLTLIGAGVATYLYLWGLDLFKIPDLERMEDEGSLGLVDGSSEGWIQGVLQIFAVAPWIILGLVVLGTCLMGLSMILVRKLYGKD